MKTEGHERKEGTVCVGAGEKKNKMRGDKPMNSRTSLKDLLKTPGLFVTYIHHAKPGPT